jgi:hypothetical protein
MSISQIPRVKPVAHFPFVFSPRRAALNRRFAERLPGHEISRYPEVVRRGLVPMEAYVRSLVVQPPFLPLPAVSLSSFPSALVLFLAPTSRSVFARSSTDFMLRSRMPLIDVHDLPAAIRSTSRSSSSGVQRTMGITRSLSSFQRTHCFKSWREPDRRNLCFREDRSWQRRHILNHDCDRTRSKGPTHRRAHLVEFASMRLRL